MSPFKVNTFARLKKHIDNKKFEKIRFLILLCNHALLQKDHISYLIISLLYSAIKTYYFPITKSGTFFKILNISMNIVF